MDSTSDSDGGRQQRPQRRAQSGGGGRGRGRPSSSSPRPRSSAAAASSPSCVGRLRPPCERECRSERDAATALKKMCPQPTSLLGASGRRGRSLTEIIDDSGAGAGFACGSGGGGGAKSGNVLEQRVTVKKTIARTFRGTVAPSDERRPDQDQCLKVPPAPTVTAGISRGGGASRQVKVVPVRHPDKKLQSTRALRPEPFQQIHMMANAYDVGSYPLVVCDEWLQYLLRPSDGVDPSAASYPPPASKANKINLVSPFSRCA